MSPYYDGVDAYANTTSSEAGPDTEITVMVRVVPLVVDGTIDVIVFGSSGDLDKYCQVAINSTKAAYFIIGDGSVWGGLNYGNKILSVNTPYTLVGTSKKDGINKLYINGVLDTSISQGTRFASAPGWKVGRWKLTAGNQYTGWAFDFRIYEKQLTDAEVWSLYDPQTRWDLYWQRRRTFFLPVAAAGGPPFPPLFARRTTDRTQLRM